MIGTLVNTASVITGSILGLLINNKLPERYIRIVFNTMGVFTLYLGVKMALEGKQILFIIFSLILGALTGEWLRLEERTNNLSELIKNKFKISNQHFTEGMITAFLMFCMGSMSILGSLEEGFGNPPNLLLTKSVMDGFSSIALSSALGIGVLFSSIPLFLYQGGLTLLAAQLKDILTSEIIAELTATGGILLIALGINILELKKIKVLNLTPALIYIVVFMLIFGG
jgi:uncharacterized membrane protein YqgA involved in biofilm formation